MADQTTTLLFHGQARTAAVWLLDETGLSQHPNLSTFAAADPFTVVLDDWYEASHDEQAVLDTLRTLSTRHYLLDVVSLSQAGAETRRACLYAVGMALDVDRRDDSARPAVSELLGADPNWLGGQSVDEYLREVRHG